MNSQTQSWKGVSGGLRVELGCMFTFGQQEEKDELRQGNEKRDIGELGDTNVIEANKKEGLEKRADFTCQRSARKKVHEPGHSKAMGSGVWMVPGLKALEQCLRVSGRGI